MLLTTAVSRDVQQSGSRERSGSRSGSRKNG